MNERHMKIMVPYEEPTDTCPDCSDIPCNCGLPAGYTPTPKAHNKIHWTNWLWMTPLGLALSPFGTCFITILYDLDFLGCVILILSQALAFAILSILTNGGE